MRTIVTLTCGHEKDYTGRKLKLPQIGDEHPCFTICDRAAHKNASPRYVAKIEDKD